MDVNHGAERRGASLSDLQYIAGRLASDASRFPELPGLLTRCLGLPWMRMDVFQKIDGVLTLECQASCARGEAHALTPEQLLGSPTMRYVPRGHGTHHVDCAETDVAERWSWSGLNADTFLLVRWGRIGVSQHLAAQVNVLVEHIARIMAMAVIWQANPKGFGQPLADLTAKEWQVLKALHSADSEKQIAGRMGLSTHTFHVHVKKIYRKLEVRSRLHLLETCARIETAQIEMTPPHDIAGGSTGPIATVSAEMPVVYIHCPKPEYARAI